jgi:hypothetical protein
MIEHLYSRMIATIASIALVSVVVSSSLSVAQQADRDCAERIARNLVQLIDAAGGMQVKSFEQRIAIDEEGAHRDLTIVLNRTHLVVRNGGFECSKGFSTSVVLLSEGISSDGLTAYSGSILKINVTDDLFDRLSEITIEVLDPSGVT